MFKNQYQTNMIGMLGVGATFGLYDMLFVMYYIWNGLGIPSLLPRNSRSPLGLVSSICKY
jgi:hypothetical protein